LSLAAALAILAPLAGRAAPLAPWHERVTAAGGWAGHGSGKWKAGQGELTYADGVAAVVARTNQYLAQHPQLGARAVKAADVRLEGKQALPQGFETAAFRVLVAKRGGAPIGALEGILSITAPGHDEINARASAVYRARSSGDALGDWLRAEATLKARAGGRAPGRQAIEREAFRNSQARQAGNEKTDWLQAERALRRGPDRVWQLWGRAGLDGVSELSPALR